MKNKFDVQKLDLDVVKALRNRNSVGLRIFLWGFGVSLLGFLVAYNRFFLFGYLLAIAGFLIGAAGIVFHILRPRIEKKL
jgi:hypothetical protein